MTEWEYKLVPYPISKNLNEIEMFLESFGSQGWELTCHDFGCFIFKRSKQC